MIKIKETGEIAGTKSRAVRCPSCKRIVMFSGSVPMRCQFCNNFLPNFLVLTLEHPVVRRIEYHLTGGILGAKVHV